MLRKMAFMRRCVATFITYKGSGQAIVDENASVENGLSEETLTVLRCAFAYVLLNYLFLKKYSRNIRS